MAGRESKHRAEEGGEGFNTDAFPDVAFHTAV